MNTSGTTHKGLTQASRFAPLAVITLALTLVASEGKAQEPRPGAAKTAQGRVESFTTALMGEVDGATLDDGTVVHWPPHLADRFTAILAKGDRIRVAGMMETGPAGDSHFEVQTVTNLRTNASAENDFSPPPPPRGPGRRPGPPPPVGPRSGEVKTIQGRVKSLTTAPMGEVDGATLDDGTVVHWPPYLADRFTAILAKGDRVRVSGRMETGPAGDTHFEAETATNIRTNASTSSELAGRPPLPGPGRVTPGGSDDFVQAPDSPQDVQRRLKSLEDQISQLREEVRRLRREP
jgi:hypothetical protein